MKMRYKKVQVLMFVCYYVCLTTITVFLLYSLRPTAFILWSNVRNLNHVSDVRCANSWQPCSTCHKLTSVSTALHAITTYPAQQLPLL